MRRLLLFFVILLPIDAAAIINYQLEVELFPAQQTLQGQALISIDESINNKLEFQLAANSIIDSVEQDGSALTYRFNRGHLKISLRSRQPVKIVYHGRFADTVSAVPVHNEDPSYGVSASIATSGTFLSSGADWYPRLKAGAIHYRLSVSAPAGYRAISSGKRVKFSDTAESSRSSWLVDYPIYGLTLSAGPYQVFSDTTGNVPIYAYFYKKSAGFAPVYLNAAREYLDLYENLFGAYPFHKFAVVENFFPTGYGFPSWTLLGSSVIRLPFIVKTSLGHEMAHSWWGTGVRVDYRQGNWAEGITTYVADYLYKERISSAEALEYRLKILRDYAVLVDEQSEFALTHFMSRHDRASQSIGYGKAAMLFHMLRQQVGDDIFWPTLKKIAEEQMFERVGWDDFARYFSAASGRNLAVFFNQWLKRPAGPILALQNVTIEQTGGVYTTSGTLRQKAKSYQLRMPVELETEDETIVQYIELEGKEQDFSIASKSKPRKLTADPAADIFRILDEKEIPATVNAIRGSRQLLAIRGDRLQPSDTAARTMLAALRKTNVEIKQLKDVSSADLATNDLLIFGVTSSLQPEELLGKKVLLSGTEQSLNGKSVFLVKANPFNESRVAAWLLSSKNNEDAVVARKIPHYGKYSFLLFEANQNKLKGTFAPEESPLLVPLVN